MNYNLLMLYFQKNNETLHALYHNKLTLYDNQTIMFDSSNEANRNIESLTIDLSLEFYYHHYYLEI